MFRFVFHINIYKRGFTKPLDMNQIIFLILLTLIPAFELRASIPYGILSTDYNPFVIFFTAVIVNIALGYLIYLMLDLLIVNLRKWSWFDRLFTKIVERPRKKIKKIVDRWGELGIALFIGVPLPGSGVYTAALGAYVLGVSKKHFFIATMLGVLIAAVAVTAISYSGETIFSWMIKR